MVDEQVLEAVNQIGFFGETQTIATYKLFNHLTSSWAKVIDEVAIPAIVELRPMIGDEEKSLLKEKLLPSIIQHGKIYQILYKSESSFKHAMKLPAGLVIPGEEENNRLNENNTPEEEEMLDEISELMAQVVRLRIEKKLLNELKDGNEWFMDQ
ncbi:unnamed protein product [Bursaphelenchus xylophilus]|uniref:(pine wood nematode) hypothetical protein n=1 Tax=Bursaphelenchus xylophilus TaxID=6326 RepID=A0A1I7SD70_BURXY|nr:unnamed protein product [Bursaphelenchus xylophilus]CAG9130522.1 unnamed protein product [Bursaphelenchus xylophilus]